MKWQTRLLAALWGGMWMGAASVSTAEESWLFYAATKTETAPVMDGRLNDPCWQGVERTRPLTCIGGAKAPVATTGMACWNEETLYLALVCAEPQMAAIQQKKAEGRLRLFDESVEIFISSARDRFTYVQFRVDIGGTRDTHVGTNPDKTLDERWTGSTAQDKDQWTVEVTIPWSLVAKEAPDEQKVWGLNFNRTRSVGPEVGYFCWSDTQGGFHAPGRFGNLVFFPYPVSLRSHFSAAFRAAYEEMDYMTRQSGTTAARAGTLLAAIRTENEQFLKSLVSAAMVQGADAAVPYARGLEQQRKLATLQDEMLLQAIRDLASSSASGKIP